MTLKIQPIVEQLVAGGGEDVEGVLEWGGLQNAPRNLAWFVMPDNETAAPNSLDGWDGGVDQQVSFGFSVVIVLPAAGRVRNRAAEDLHDQIKLVKAAMRRWQHPDASDFTIFAGGRLLSADGQSVAWAVRFTTKYNERST